MNNPDLDFRHPTPPPPPPPPPPPMLQSHRYQSILVSVPTAVPFASSSSTSFNLPESSNAPQPHHYQQNPRKKRSKLMRPVDADNPAKRPKTARKPDPAAPKITTPCSECGRKFWSWKALFGHMRCHPERHWRGIQPPPDFRRTGSPPPTSNPSEFVENSSMSEDDHDAASSLLILARGATDQTQLLLPGTTTSSQCLRENDCRFECSSCKKVFGSPQALGGHRASHKNVKGCFANPKSDVEVDEEVGSFVPVAAGRGSYGVVGDSSNVEDVTEENNSRMAMAAGESSSGHQCSICWRVFSSGQALGGHKRCHWEKGEEASVVMTQLGGNSAAGIDLNLLPATAACAPAVDDARSSSYTSPAVALDLRLGL